MKKTSSLLFFVFLLINVLSRAQSPDQIEGNWLTASKKAFVKIYKDGNVYNGKITWLKAPLDSSGRPKVDKHNPDRTQRGMPLLGLNLLKGFVFKNNQWENGTIYDPENGKTYSCRIRYRNGMLDLRGYIGISLIGRTETWYKAEIK